MIENEFIKFVNKMTSVIEEMQKTMLTMTERIILLEKAVKEMEEKDEKASTNEI